MGIEPILNWFLQTNLHTGIEYLLLCSRTGIRTRTEQSLKLLSPSSWTMRPGIAVAPVRFELTLY
jgi:hypothetical protein